MLAHHHCDLRDSEGNSRATEEVFWGDIERSRELHLNISGEQDCQ